MKTSPIFIFAVVSSLFTIAASAALPAFLPQTLALPPLTLAEIGKSGLHPFDRSEPAAPMPLLIPDRRIRRADKSVLSPSKDGDYKMLIKEPDSSVDYKLLIKRPDASVDYRMIVKEVGTESGK